jgi:pimeloyl-ACP methyl ester carboxylesterase
MTAAQSGLADINGAKMYYEVAGSGHPLIMVHAGIAHSGMWDDQFAFFAEHYQVIRFDMRGFGQTVPVEGEFSNREDLHALLKHLRVERAYLMGCSKGGGVCMDFALEHPEMATALIMVGSGPGGFEFETEPPKQRDEIIKTFEAGDLERTSELETQVWVDGQGRTPDQVNPAVRRKVFEMNLMALKYEKMGLGKEKPLDPPAVQRIQELKLPTLIVYGDLDTPYIVAAADFMARHIAGAKKALMPGTAHVPNMERPAEFNQQVLAFL